MKKTAVLAFLLLVAGCSSFSGLWEEKDVWMQNRSAYSITFFDNTPQLMKSETYTEKTKRTNQIMTAYRGQSVLYVKTFTKDTYASQVLRINQAGELNNASVPVTFKKGDTRKIIGTASIDGSDYYLVPSDLENYVFLVRDNGTFYRKMGQIRNGNLVLMLTDFVPYPDDLRFEPVTNSSAEQARPTDGFEIRYEGINRGKMRFTYMKFGESGDGTFDTIELPAAVGTVSLRGNNVNIISVTDDKINYTLLD